MTSTTAVKERPILFSGLMVRAILDGKKTQTRRAINPLPCHWAHPGGKEIGFTWKPHFGDGPTWPREEFVKKCPYGQPGDLLWVRESAWYDRKVMKDIGARCFYVDGKVKMERTGDYGWSIGGDVQAAAGHLEELYRLNSSLVKKPSIFMPRWASRITLEVSKVRVERIQDMHHNDWRADFAPSSGQIDSALATFVGDKNRRVMSEHLWDSINAERGFPWSSNPWVWVVEFRSRRLTT